jgi:hypothetical protein
MGISVSVVLYVNLVKTNFLIVYVIDVSVKQSF